MSIRLSLDLKQRKPSLCGSPFSFQILHFGETKNLYAHTHIGSKIFDRFEYFLVSTESEFLIFLNVPWCSQTPFWFPTLFLLSCLPQGLKKLTPSIRTGLLWHIMTNGAFIFTLLEVEGHANQSDLYSLTRLLFLLYESILKTAGTSWPPQWL